MLLHFQVVANCVDQRFTPGAQTLHTDYVKLDVIMRKVHTHNQKHKQI